MEKYESIIYNYLVIALDEGIKTEEDVIELDVASQVLVHLGLDKSPKVDYYKNEINKIIKKHLSKFLVPFRFDKFSDCWELFMKGSKINYILFKLGI